MAGTREKLIELAERCEQASEPDRGIDGAIDRMFNERPKNGDYDAAENAIWRVTDEWSGLLVRGDGFARNSFCARQYTASLDAAMDLVEPRALWAQGSMEEGPFARLCWPLPDGSYVGGYYEATAATVPLAMCAAALRARAAAEARS
jgi:hypothetical protein